MKITDIIKGKVKFIEGSDGIILDEQGNHILDTRGYGRFSTEFKDINTYSIEKMLAEFIAKAINEKLEKNENKV